MWSIQGAGNDNCAHILLWNRPGGSGYDMAAHGKAACVLGRSTGNCYGDDRDPYVMQSFRYRMYEMEKAAKNGFARMLLSRMVVLSVGDLVTVLLCMIMISSKNYASGRYGSAVVSGTVILDRKLLHGVDAEDRSKNLIWKIRP